MLAIIRTVFSPGWPILVALTLLACAYCNGQDEITELRDIARLTTSHYATISGSRFWCQPFRKEKRCCLVNRPDLTSLYDRCIDIVGVPVPIPVGFNGAPLSPAAGGPRPRAGLHGLAIKIRPSTNNAHPSSLFLRSDQILNNAPGLPLAAIEQTPEFIAFGEPPGIRLGNRLPSRPIPPPIAPAIGFGGLSPTIIGDGSFGGIQAPAPPPPSLIGGEGGPFQGISKPRRRRIGFGSRPLIPPPIPLQSTIPQTGFKPTRPTATNFRRPFVQQQSPVSRRRPQPPPPRLKFVAGSTNTTPRRQPHRTSVPDIPNNNNGGQAAARSSVFRRIPPPSKNNRRNSGFRNAPAIVGAAAATVISHQTQQPGPRTIQSEQRTSANTVSASRLSISASAASKSLFSRPGTQIKGAVPVQKKNFFGPPTPTKKQQPQPLNPPPRISFKRANPPTPAAFSVSAAQRWSENPNTGGEKRKKQIGNNRGGGGGGLRSAATPQQRQKGSPEAIRHSSESSSLPAATDNLGHNFVEDKDSLFSTTSEKTKSSSRGRKIWPPHNHGPLPGRVPCRRRPWGCRPDRIQPYPKSKRRLIRPRGGRDAFDSAETSEELETLFPAASANKRRRGNSHRRIDKNDQKRHQKPRGNSPNELIPKRIVRFDSGEKSTEENESHIISSHSRGIHIQSSNSRAPTKPFLPAKPTETFPGSILGETTEKNIKFDSSEKSEELENFISTLNNPKTEPEKKLDSSKSAFTKNRRSKFLRRNRFDGGRSSARPPQSSTNSNGQQGARLNRRRNGSNISLRRSLTTPKSPRTLDLLKTTTTTSNPALPTSPRLAAARRLRRPFTATETTGGQRTFSRTTLKGRVGIRSRALGASITNFIQSGTDDEPSLIPPTKAESSSTRSSSSSSINIRRLPPPRTDVEFFENSNCFLNLLLIVDASGSVRTRFQTELQLASEVVDRLTIAESKSKVGFIKFAGPNKSRVIFGFNDYMDKDKIKSEILSVTHSSGTTHTGEALELADVEFAKERRPGARPVIIIFTDGFSAEDPARAAMLLHDKDVLIFAVAIDSPRDDLELARIAGHSSRVFTNRSFSQFQERLNQLTKDC